MLKLIYAPSTVIHMLSGKAIARAVRAHFIVDAALNALMLRKVFNVPLPCHTEAPESNDSDNDEAADSDSVETDDVDNSQYLDEARTFYELMSGNISAEEAYSSNVLEKIKGYLKETAESVKISSRASALWVQYMSMINILRKFIRAECTGNWELHLQSIQAMLPYMAASGHNSYTKSGTLYLQQMSNLPTQHSNVYHHFRDGLHVRYEEATDCGLVFHLTLSLSKF